MDIRKWFHRFGPLKKRQSDSSRVIQAIEMERRRISRELHDSVGQALYSVLVGVKIVSMLKVDESVRDHFLQIEQLTAKALDEVKRMAHDLHPSTLDELGLESAIRALVERFEFTFGISTRFIQSGEISRYNNETEIVLYRICQEAISNVAKYAQTTQLEVNLIDEITSVRLIVQDFGQGFRVEEHDNTNREGIGLISIRERTNALGGTVMINSTPGKGTTIEVVIPIAK